MFLSLLLFESSTADVFELALSCKIDWKNQTSEKIEIWLKNQLENYQEFAANLWWKIDQKKRQKTKNKKQKNGWKPPKIQLNIGAEIWLKLHRIIDRNLTWKHPEIWLWFDWIINQNVTRKCLEIWLQFLVTNWVTNSTKYLT